MLGAGEALYEELGASPMSWLKRGNDQALGLISERLNNSQLAHSLHEGRRITADAAIALALDELGIEN